MRHKYFSHHPICLFLDHEIFDFEKIRNVDDNFRKEISEIIHKVENLNINPATFNEFNKGSSKYLKRRSWICCMC